MRSFLLSSSVYLAYIPLTHVLIGSNSLVLLGSYFVGSSVYLSSYIEFTTKYHNTCLKTPAKILAYTAADAVVMMPNWCSVKSSKSFYQQAPNDIANSFTKYNFKYIAQTATEKAITAYSPLVSFSGAIAMECYKLHRDDEDLFLDSLISVAAGTLRRESYKYFQNSGLGPTGVYIGYSSADAVLTFVQYHTESSYEEDSNSTLIGENT